MVVVVAAVDMVVAAEEATVVVVEVEMLVDTEVAVVVVERKEEGVAVEDKGSWCTDL